MKILNAKYLIFLLNMLWVIPAFAQQDTVKKVAFGEDFTFKEGIYMSFRDFKHNNPIPPNRIITEVSRDDYEFYQKVLNGRFFHVFDDLGSAQRVQKSAVWGYVSNGNIYIYYNEMFNLISYVGSISHFLSEKKVYDNYGTSFYNDYTISRRMPTTVTTKTEQYILSMFTGKVHEYNTKSVSTELMRDPELHDKYQQLSRKKRQQMKFYYIRKFNDRNPFYIYK